MAIGLTETAARIQRAVQPVLSAMAAGTPGVGPDDIEDLIQTTVENVMSRLKAGADIVNIDAYAKTTARYVFYALVKKRKMVVVLEPPSADATPLIEPWLVRMAGAFEPSPSEQAIAAEDRPRYAEQIRRALGTLTGPEREVLTLRHGVGLGAEEVAACTGYKNAATVDTVAARARRKIERQLSPSLLWWAQGHRRR